ncbi:hypothetical protein QZH41_004976 [Actinostola sp. cb2023]|nr:hypothetical protein QZH41_004976 [Actinostola sp. cb2023]
MKMAVCYGFFEGFQNESDAFSCQRGRPVQMRVDKSRGLVPSPTRLQIHDSDKIHYKAVEEDEASRPHSLELEEVRVLFEKLMENKKSIEEVSGANVLDTIRERVLSRQQSARENSRTAALWLQYMDMIDILRTFIKAERTANWELHLHALSKMLPYLAASGHNLYVKCTQLYLQSMTKLQSDHPDVYRDFLSGLHVVRRSDRSWAGLSTDLIIEQVLMRSLKTSGGLTRGRGMTEQQRLTWLLSMPACAETNRAMQELTGVQFNSGEQNKDMSNSRQQRDMEDTLTILKALTDRNPFVPNPSLRNIMNGVNADSSVNVDTAKVIGEKILTSMTGQFPSEYTFKRSAQRLILACNSSDDLEALFRYELCSYPTALFDSSLMLRQPQKPVLVDAISSKLTPDATTGPAGDAQYVLDGGSLLHRIAWPKGSATFKEVCGLYCSYVTRKYGRPIIVFDGYDQVSTKNMTQQRRAAGKVGPTVTFSEDMKVTTKKDLFLSNVKNKQRFIDMLSKFLKTNNCQTRHAVSDADLLIVKTSVESARARNTILVGDDTDLLVLLCYYARSDGCDLYLRPEPKANSTKRRVFNMKKVKAQLGEDICNNILFIHAILGCDTTSRLYGIGKGAAIKKYADSQYFREQAKVFDDFSSSVEKVATAGENALISLYNGKPGNGLDSLRYHRYCEKLATKNTQIQPQNLPPTSAAASTLRCTCRKHNLECSPACGQCKGSGCSNSTDQLLYYDSDE